MTPETGEPGFLSETVDLGEQRWGTRSPFQFGFLNAAKEAVAIRSVAQSCACTVVDSARFVGRLLEPGETVLIDGTIDAGTRAGKLLREVRLTLVDGRTFAARIVLSVVPTYTVSTSLIDFGLVPLEAIEKRRQTVLFAGHGVELLEKPRVSSEWVRARCVMDAPGQGHVEVELLPEALAEGLNPAFVVVETSDSVVPTQTIGVRAVGVQPLRAVPGAIVLASEPVRATFIDAAGERAQIVSAQYDPEVIRCLIADGVLVLERTPGPSAAKSVRVRVEDGAGRWGTVLVHMY